MIVADSFFHHLQHAVLAGLSQFIYIIAWLLRLGGVDDHA